MQADVTVEGIREVGAEGRPSRLIRDQLALGRERKPVEIVPTAHAGQSRSPESVCAQHVAKPRLQPVELHRAKLVGVPFGRNHARPRLAVSGRRRSSDAMLTLTMREVIPAVVLLALGTQIIFASFFISILVSGSKSTSRALRESHVDEKREREKAVARLQ